MEYDRISIEKMSRKELIKELSEIPKLQFPGTVAKQNETKIVMWLWKQDGIISQELYENFWNEKK